MVVFDTVTIVQSVINPKGPAGRCLAYLEQGKISVAVSRNTLKEISDVLSRPYLRERYQQITDERVGALIRRLTYKGQYLRHVPRHLTYPRDPHDEPYLNLAIEVLADYLVSWDNDLLDLMKWEQEAGREFQKQFRFLQIVTPPAFLQVMEPNLL